MICDHSTIKKTSTGDKFTLVYCDGKVLYAKYTPEVTESRHTTETFTTIQSLVDRGLSLGLTCNVDFLIKALEHGATLPEEVITILIGDVWDSGYSNTLRMKALGYEPPKIEKRERR